MNSKQYNTKHGYHYSAKPSFLTLDESGFSVGTDRSLISIVDQGNGRNAHHRNSR